MAKKTKTINLSELGQIEYEDYLMPFINSRNFQQLRNKKNTAFLDRVYPSNRRVRLEHCLGVCEIAKRIYTRLLENNPRLFKNKKEREFYKKNIQFAALGHDLAHAPFSHTIEPVYFKFAQQLSKIQITRRDKKNVAKCEDHEELTSLILNGAILFRDKKMRGKMPAQLISQAGASPKHVSKLILKGKYAKAYPRNAFLQELIFASQLPFDADILEYLHKDPPTTGLISHFDLGRVINNLSTHNREIAISEKALNELNNIAFTMKTQLNCAYLHHANEKLDAMLVNVLGYFDFKKFPGQALLYGDEILIHELLKLTQGNAHELTERIYDRELLSEIKYSELETDENTLKKLDLKYYSGNKQNKNNAEDKLNLKHKLQEKIANIAGINKYFVAVDFRKQGCAISEKREKNDSGNLQVIMSDGLVVKLNSPKTKQKYETLKQIQKLPLIAGPLSTYTKKDYVDKVRDAVNQVFQKL